MRSPTVSVVIPCYNQGQFLAEALESVYAQSLPASEVFVIDDGSTDTTRAVARRYARARYLAQPNLGLARARNRGVRASTGEYLVFLDADDRLRPDALATGLREIEAYPEAALAYGRCQRIDARGRPLPTTPPDPLGSDAYAALLRQNLIWTPAVVMFRRSVVAPLLRFDPAVDASADYELYLRIARRLPIREHPAVVADYRLHGASMSHDAALMLTTTLRVFRAQRRLLDTPARARAYRAGLRGWRRLYGDQIVEDLRAGWFQPARWPELASAVAVLARHDPGALATHAGRKLLRLLTPANRPGPPPRRRLTRA